MPTYRTSARNQFRTPLGAVGDPPDVPGYLSTFSDDLDNILGFNGTEYAATTAARDAIPTGRKFIGKLVRVNADGITYIWTGSAWSPWDSGPSNYTPTFQSTFAIGNGSMGGSFWFANGVLQFKMVITWGSTTSATGSILFALPGIGSAVDTSYPHVGNGFVYKAGTGYTHLAAVLNTGYRYTLLPSGSNTGLSSTAPYTLASGDQIAVTGQAKY